MQMPFMQCAMTAVKHYQGCVLSRFTARIVLKLSGGSIGKLNVLKFVTIVSDYYHKFDNISSLDYGHLSYSCE